MPKIALYNKKYLLFLLFILLFQLSNAANNQNSVYISYIEKYKRLAILHMQEYKIPASITLSQGLLESGAGKSDLALNSNNHFGIKCNSDWKGQKVYAKDDTPNDCFRKYTKVDQSYEDHSLFLRNRDRYSALFKLETTDYRGWAQGLQKAGYATDKAYANKLIKIIEDYELYLYDKVGDIAKIEKEEEIILAPNVSKHMVYKTYGLVYVIAQKNDTFESIASEFNFEVSNLYQFNEVPEEFPLQEGDIVYFQTKKKKADKPNYEHTVKVGESMHNISQRYGLKLEQLYRMNKKSLGYIPVEGDVLKLR